ncbi:MBL fold metallo-hydrolase [Burkholderia sp. Tr-20390]|uniref:MBL fold metallo-hydrolase n=1 Tax=Burkholderia sp. Tr-20390 TaxID=2703904 RepID=UPI00197DCEE0|nr:MBL fold metallo-hydrolase [Burkholderia sp. Tr-20390]MBN3731722.1 hypothetical protein [Burkholderia sp. Tr-20390]
MKVTFIGHESWLVSCRGFNFLVDPILENGFGSDSRREFTIQPRRVVDVDGMPPISAIIYTTEHLQHFHPRSLVKVRKKMRIAELRVFVPELFPIAAQKIIEELGFICERIPCGVDFAFEGARFRFYMPHKDVLFWDSRVSSLYIEEMGESILIQSDTLISDDYYSDILKKVALKPSLLIVTNNFQRSKEGFSIGLDNLLPVEDEKYKKAAGLRLLNSLISVPIKRIGSAPRILIVGNGYNNHNNSIDHIWSNEKLANAARELSILGGVSALSPGFSYCMEFESISEGVSWIHDPGHEEYNEEEKGGRCKDEGNVSMSSHEIKLALDDMAKSWIITRYGQAILSQQTYLGRDLGSKKVVIVLTSEKGDLHFVFDVSTVSFHEVGRCDDPMREYPFGIIADYSDFVDMLSGKIQVWELMNFSASQWYVCNRYDSPLAFMLEYFGEQADNDLAYKTYKSSLNFGIDLIPEQGSKAEFL